MNDWNDNGKYDDMDSYIDYKLSGGDKYTGSRRKKSGGPGRGLLIYIIFMFIMLALVPAVGIIMLVALICIWMCGGL